MFDFALFKNSVDIRSQRSQLWFKLYHQFRPVLWWDIVKIINNDCAVQTFILREIDGLVNYEKKDA